MAAGAIYLGRDLDRRELWISPDDARQHATVPGTTGAGKTTAIVSFLANALSHASGFVLVDGKADNKLYGEVLALARRFGREDDVLCLNFMVASGAKESNTFNPFAVGNADAIGEMLTSQLGESASGDSNQVFRDRAVALVGTMAPVLVWMRDNKGVALNIDTIRMSFELRGIWKIAMKKQFELRDPATGEVRDIDVPGIPEDIIYPLKAYLGELPAYDMTLDWNQQKTEEPSRQHGYAVFYFTRTFELLGVSLGHIFKVEQSDVDMRDVVLNRRILVVNLPALESSDDRLAALGKIVVASLRGMMAQMLGSRLEGDYGDIVANKPGMGAAPFHVVLDEVAYYATSGMDRMLAMGRGLNFMFWLGFQEVSGIWARLGEKTQSLLGNANLTVAMRQQDANRTRQWIEETAGTTYVSQATSYQGGSGGEYSEAQHADLREVSRVDWSDLQRLIEGEAIILFGGRRIYAKLFYAAVDTSGPLRLNRPLPMASPDPIVIMAECEKIDALIGAIEQGLADAGSRAPRSATLGAMLDAFAGAAARGENAEACVAAAIKAAGAVLFALPTAPGEKLTPFSRMLEFGLGEARGAPADDAPPTGPVDAKVLATLVEIETSAGASEEEARAAALSVAAGRESVLRSLEATRAGPENETKLLEEIEALIVGVESAKTAPGPEHVIEEAGRTMKSAGISR
ncbi:Intracellular multiplication protein IcmO [Methylocella tundrae]|nr:Intracellular multiplication protein IcmO [Methylocella tundrae]